LDDMARLNITAMRVGPGKHLQGRVLMDGVISLEEGSSSRNSLACCAYTLFTVRPISRAYSQPGTRQVACAGSVLCQTHSYLLRRPSRL
jgi:hypothetical protein